MKTKIGIMGEDRSDVDTLWVLIRRIKNSRFKVKKHGFKGCARLRRKCGPLARRWTEESVTHLIICHDLDCNDTNRLRCLKNELKDKVAHIPDCDNIVCIVIPIQELEAWLLADSDALNNKFSGMDLPPIPNPERISSPKEYIERESRTKKWRPRYVNTIHNRELAASLDIDAIYTKCPAFRPFYSFISALR